MQDLTTTARVAQLNDELRATMGLRTGRLVTTRGVASQTPETKIDVFKAVKTFSDFTPENDPYGEHDFGKVVVGDKDYFWKIDYFDKPHFYHHSIEKANPEVTTRVLTIMLASEY